MDEIVDVYEKVLSRRLVVLGRPGSGKTVLVGRFVKGMVSRADRVPVVFRIGSWDPTATGALGVVDLDDLRDLDAD